MGRTTFVRISNVISYFKQKKHISLGNRLTRVEASKKIKPAWFYLKYYYYSDRPKNVKFRFSHTPWHRICFRTQFDFELEQKKRFRFLCKFAWNGKTYVLLSQFINPLTKLLLAYCVRRKSTMLENVILAPSVVSEKPIPSIAVPRGFINFAYYLEQWNWENSDMIKEHRKNMKKAWKGVSPEYRKPVRPPDYGWYFHYGWMEDNED